MVGSSTDSSGSKGWITTHSKLAEGPTTEWSPLEQGFWSGRWTLPARWEHPWEKATVGGGNNHIAHFDVGNLLKKLHHHPIACLPPHNPHGAATAHLGSHAAGGITHQQHPRGIGRNRHNPPYQTSRPSHHIAGATPLRLPWFRIKCCHQ
jgi:hypothetical protein